MTVHEQDYTLVTCLQCSRDSDFTIARDYMSKGGQVHDGEICRKKTEQSSQKLRTLDQALWSLHGTKQGLPHVGDSGEVWTV